MRFNTLFILFWTLNKTTWLTSNLIQYLESQAGIPLCVVVWFKVFIQTFLPTLILELNTFCKNEVLKWQINHPINQFWLPLLIGASLKWLGMIERVMTYLWAWTDCSKGTTSLPNRPHYVVFFYCGRNLLFSHGDTIKKKLSKPG